MLRATHILCAWTNLRAANPARSSFVQEAASGHKHHVDMFIWKGCPEGSTSCTIGVQAKFVYNKVRNSPTPASETQLITVPIGQRGSDEWNTAVDKRGEDRTGPVRDPRGAVDIRTQ